METIILLILVTILIFVIKNNSDISLIKAQNELNHFNLERLRKRLENFENKGEAEIQNVIETNTETEECPDLNIGTLLQIMRRKKDSRPSRHSLRQPSTATNRTLLIQTNALRMRSHPTKSMQVIHARPIGKDSSESIFSVK